MLAGQKKMTYLLIIIMQLGDTFTYFFGNWQAAIFAAIVIIDLIIGLKRKYFVVIAIVQIIIVAAGIVWTFYEFNKQDVAGPYAWALAVGFWFVITILLHAAYAIYGLKERWRT